MLVQLFALALVLLPAPTLGNDQKPIFNAYVQVRHSSLLGYLLIHGLATHSNTNITIALFSDTDSPSCNKDDTKPPDTSKALVLTTNSVTLSFTCFNTSDIFSQPNTTGSTNGTTSWVEGTKEDLADHVDWLIKGLDNFDSTANYSHVWYEQNSHLGQVEEGLNARWVLYFYAFENCQQISPVGSKSEDTPAKDNPWFETSCQTKGGGQCRELPKSVKSFALNKADEYNAGHGGCAKWAFLGGAAHTQGMWSIEFIFTVVGCARYCCCYDAGEPVRWLLLKTGLRGFFCSFSFLCAFSPC